jgi:hypothetical protein
MDAGRLNKERICTGVRRGERERERRVKGWLTRVERAWDVVVRLPSTSLTPGALTTQLCREARSHFWSCSHDNRRETPLFFFKPRSRPPSTSQALYCS